VLIPIKVLPVEGITGVIHVGAHKAEELSHYVSSGISRILWIEANENLYTEIEEAIDSFPLMRLGKFAAGDEERVGDLYITNDTQSTSMLKLKTHTVEYPNISKVDEVEVPVKRLDTWLDEIKAEREKFNLLNLDIQGYELNAIRGCIKQLEYIEYVYTEINRDELYEGCASYLEIDNFLERHGFKRVATVWCKHGWGDALYSRNNHRWMQTRVEFALAKRYLINKKEKVSGIYSKLLDRMQNKCNQS